MVDVTAAGERDPETIKERALNALGVSDCLGNLS
jgi:hypothetical protein